MTLNVKVFGYLLLFLVTINQAKADFTSCPNNFYKQVAPTYQNAELVKQTYSLCFHGFAVLYSGQSRTPLWSAEYLTRERIEQANKMEREDSFHEESQLPDKAQAKLKHYSKSGYDRGHLAPNSDMANHNQQYDSFSLANIAPQSPYINRNTWKQVESTTRYLTKIHGKAYVLTGTVFIDSYQMGKIGEAVSIPSHLYKVVYLPAINQAGVYYAPNDESGRVTIISINELAKRTGVNALPALSNNVKSIASNLPLPHESLFDNHTAFENGLDITKIANNHTINNTESNYENNAENATNNAKNTNNTESKTSSWIWFGQWLVEMVKWIKQQLY